MPDAEMLAQVYATYGYEQNGLATVPPFIFDILSGVVRTFSPYRSRHARLLDVGFGAGALLRVARDAGWNTHGVEASRAAVDQGNRHRLGELVHGDFLHATWPEGHFDVVVMTELVEHLILPESFLEAAARLLRPGGLLYMTTPHGRGISGRMLGASWSVLRPPEHLHLFSIASMKELLRRTSFVGARVYTQGILPHEIAAHLRRRLGVALRGGDLSTRQRVDGPSNTPPANPDRVQDSSRLNESVMHTGLGRLGKRLANEVLRTARLGDSLRVYAQR
jgi:2-polyprenyl-3-methyl-5-hydroxy-6-metoxy-1,4-benzoquinol methylase